ncbi:MAG: hypothetical protein SGPRY_002024, partial [Prymnesium sp.]
VVGLVLIMVLHRRVREVGSVLRVLLVDDRRRFPDGDILALVLHEACRLMSHLLSHNMASASCDLGRKLYLHCCFGRATGLLHRHSIMLHGNNCRLHLRAFPLLQPEVCDEGAVRYAVFLGNLPDCLARPMA